ncbi:hypothetical protein F1654_05985 [Alkalicaulis satelles]|uniref:Uncharacterized protein n=1 Tax=Alkalicaulis satelles TaxID=2609175 RepID=A0A5M6ZF33_9PROT|nr:hypothetical protein [Alkalicaulis satelles]KAA5803356.1 hypothetical protein F1654_05985 [Alkalicaulis satelles]
MLSTVLASIMLSSANPAVDALTEHALQVDTGALTYIVFFEADGAYTTSIGAGGTWEINDDGEFCVSSATGDANCQPLMEDLSLGDSWEGENAAGEPVTFTLIARE